MSPSIRSPVLTVFLVTSLILTSCGKAPDTSADTSRSATPHATTQTTTQPTTQASSDMAQAVFAPSATQDSTHTLGSQVTTQQTNNPALENKQLLITANAHFEVEDVVQSVNQIEKLTLQNSGYIADSRIDNDERGRSSYHIGNQQQKVLVQYVRQATMLVRVPKNQVATFLQQLQTQVKFLQNSQFSAKDVTLDLQKAQLEAQIQASKQTALEKQNLDNTSEKTQAGNVALIEQSTLAQQEKLYAQLQQQAIQDQITLSTIELTFSQPEKLRVEILPDIEAVIENEKTASFPARLVDNLKSGWLYFVEFLLWLSQLWVFLIGLGLLAWAIRWWHKRTAHLAVAKVEKPPVVLQTEGETEKNTLLD